MEILSLWICICTLRIPIHHGYPYYIADIRRDIHASLRLTIYGESGGYPLLVQISCGLPEKLLRPHMDIHVSSFTSEGETQGIERKLI